MATVAKLMWENGPDTPIDANNLSEAVDFQSQGKFINFTNQQDDYTKWSEKIWSEQWPQLATWDQQNTYLNKIIYNFYDNTVRRPIFDSDLGAKVWEYLPTPYKKILRVKAKTKISAYYKVAATQKPQTINYDFGEEDQIFTIDDLLVSSGVRDFKASKRYFIYLYVKYSFNDAAQIKIVEEVDDTATFWKTDSVVVGSPTGNNFITCRKIGGFKTTATREIDPESIWDLSTYIDEIAATKIKIFDNGEVRQIGASDFVVEDIDNLFSSSNQTLTVDNALFQTRVLVNNLNQRFYTNRRFGMNLQFSHILPNGTSYALAPINSLTLRLTPGFMDIVGTQVNKNDTIYFSSTTQGIKINSGTSLVYNARLVPEDDLSGRVLYPGVWRIFMDFNGIFTFKHELATDGLPRWIPNYFGWFDLLGKRCIGKFRVRSDGGNYIEKFSVTDTFDINAPTNSIHIHYGTICPDGLLPCDGKWHDVTGIDSNAYNYEDLPAPSLWGQRWFEEAPDYMHKTLRGAHVSMQNIVAGAFNPITGAGGANDYTMLGGLEEHKHSFPHGHTPGTYNVLPSGAHPGDHQVEFNGSTQYVEVNPLPSGTGQKVSVYNHTHNMTITGGDHTHNKDNFSGKSEVLLEDSADTQSSSSWPSYREALICIKKV